MFVENVWDNVYLIDTFSLGVGGIVGTYLVIDEKVVLIDPGYASSLEKIIEGLKSIGVNTSEIDYIVLSHIHLDHAGSAGQLVRLASNALIYVHPKGAYHLVNPSKLLDSVRKVYGKDVNMFGEVLPVPENRIVTVKDGEELSIGSSRLRFIYARGHAPHHMVIYHVGEKLLFSGDAFSMNIPTLFPLDIPATAPPSYDHELTVEMIKKVSKLEGRAIMRPHFGSTLWSQEFFNEQLKIHEDWKNLVLEMLRTHRENAFDYVLKYLANQSSMQVDEIPWIVKMNLKVYFAGMKKYLEDSGFIKQV